MQNRPISLLLDQGVPANAAALFRELGYPCWHVSEFGMQQAEDEQILSIAAERGLVVITLDADFHALVAVRGLSQPSVIRLRKEGCRAEAVVSALKGTLVRFEMQLIGGCLISVKDARITVRRLPIGKPGD